MKFFSWSTSKDEIGLDHMRSDFAESNDFSGLPLRDTEKGFWERICPALACGAGLFSDGYLNVFVISRFAP